MSKFERPDAWEALEQEELAFWRRRSLAERAAAACQLANELLSVDRQQRPGPSVGDDPRRVEKLAGWIALKERLRGHVGNPASSKTSSDVR